MAIVRVRLLQMGRFLVIYHAMKLQPLARRRPQREIRHARQLLQPCLGQPLEAHDHGVEQHPKDARARRVDCYGVGHAPPPASKLKSAGVLGIFGGKDHSAQEFAALEKSLREAGVSFEKHVYPEGDHAFLNEQRKDVYRPADAKDAWSRILAFLKANVR